MKRTTITIDDDLAVRLEREQRRQGNSASAVIREALEAYLNSRRQPRRLSFANLGATGTGEAVGRNAEAILADHYADDIARRNGIDLRTDQQQTPELVSAGRVNSEDHS